MLKGGMRYAFPPYGLSNPVPTPTRSIKIDRILICLDMDIAQLIYLKVRH